MPLNESRGRRPKERWPASFDIEGIDRDTETRKAKLIELQQGGELDQNYRSVSNNFTAGNPEYRDMSRPIIVPYRYQHYPLCLYHPTEKTKESKLARAKVETFNHLHPATPNNVPDLLPLTVIVKNEAEEEKWKAKGFTEQAPNPYGDEEPSLEAQMQEAPELCAMGCGKPPHKGRCKKVRDDGNS